jgi:hypothetical protein
VDTDRRLGGYVVMDNGVVWECAWWMGSGWRGMELLGVSGSMWEVLWSTQARVHASSFLSGAGNLGYVLHNLSRAGTWPGWYLAGGCSLNADQSIQLHARWSVWLAGVLALAQRAQRSAQHALLIGHLSK